MDNKIVLVSILTYRLNQLISLWDS